MYKKIITRAITIDWNDVLLISSAIVAPTCTDLSTLASLDKALKIVS